MDYETMYLSFEIDQEKLQQLQKLVNKTALYDDSNEHVTITTRLIGKTDQKLTALESADAKLV